MSIKGACAPFLFAWAVILRVYPELVEGPSKDQPNACDNAAILSRFTRSSMCTYTIVC